MKSKHKRYIIALITLAIGLVVLGFAASFIFGFGVGLAGGTSAGALYWIAATIVVAPVLHLFISELLLWARNYNEGSKSSANSQTTTLENQPRDGK